LRQVVMKFNQRFDAVYLQLLLAANNSLQATPKAFRVASSSFG